MDNHYFCRTLVWGGALLLIVGLDSCQRASYSFQSVPGVCAVPAEAVAPVGILAPVTNSPLPKAPAGVAKQIAGWKTYINIRQKPAVCSANKAAITRLAQRAGLMMRNPLVRHNSIARPAKQIPDSIPEQPHLKGIAVLLGVLLGMFGAHLFYLGYPRRALGYLIPTLVCIGLLFIAIPVANSAAFGSGIGGALVGIFILVMAAGGIALTYLKALFDVVRILTGSLP